MIEFIIELNTSYITHWYFLITSKWRRGSVFFGGDYPPFIDPNKNGILTLWSKSGVKHRWYNELYRVDLPPRLKMQSSRHHQDDMKHFYVFETVEQKHPSFATTVSHPGGG